jgi:hypothetical protein
MRIAEYHRTLAIMIFSRYGPLAWGRDTLGKAVLKVAKSKPLPRPFQIFNQESLKNRRLEWCEEGDLNPHAISGTSPSN